MEPVYNPLNTFNTNVVKEENPLNLKNPTEIKIKKLFESKKNNSLMFSLDNELPRVVDVDDKRDSIEKVRDRKNSQEKLKERKGSREIFIKCSARTELEFAKNS